MKQNQQFIDKPFRVFRDIDLVGLVPRSLDDHAEMVAATRESIMKVFGDFWETMELSPDGFTLLDGFLFLFNEPEFSAWHRFDWWEQRRHIREIKEHRIYTGRARLLLEKSCLASYIGYSDDKVARSTDQEVKHAWMRKRLVLKESYWNAIDSISHAAYYRKKYQTLFPALCLLLCDITDKNGKKTEFVLGIDNGTGCLYKKKSRESSMFRLAYKIYKFFFRSGIFYIGGLELGLLETDSRISCHGSGAVVYQGWE